MNFSGLKHKAFAQFCAVSCVQEANACEDLFLEKARSNAKKNFGK